MGIKNSNTDVSAAELNIFGKGTSVEGDISTLSSIRIDGKLKGKLICKQTLTIGPGGVIEGEIEAENAIVGGAVNGKLHVKQKLVLESGSSMNGELRAGKLIIDEGAIFDGTSSMGSKTEFVSSEKTKPE